MNSRRLMIIAARTAVVLVIAIVVFTVLGWSSFAFIAVGLIAVATVIQLGGALWLRRSEQPQSDSETRHVPEMGSEL